LSRFLRFRNVRIHRAPGIQPGFSVDRLSEGLNLVVGPNGIGKSTVARTIQRFLWSDASEASGIEYSAEIERDSEVSVGEVHHGRTAWSGFATACGEPKLADRYHLRIDRLLQDSEQAGDLFENVLRELRGGVNIKKLRDQFPKKRLPSSTVGEAQRALATAQNAAHGADRRREVELPDLRAQLDAATAALNNQNRLLSLRELLSTTLDYEQLRQKTESVPEFVRELIEISIPTLNQIESELAKAELEADRLVRVEAAQAQPGRDAPPVDPARDATLARWREQLSGLEGDLRNLRAEASRAESRRQLVEVQLREAGIDADSVPKLDAAGWQKLEDALRDWLGREAELKGVLGLASLLPEKSTASDRHLLVAQIRSLSAWLESPDTAIPKLESTPQSPGVIWGLAAAGVLAVLAGTAVGDSISWAGVVVGALLLVGAVFLALRGQNTVSFEEPQKPVLADIENPNRQGVIEALSLSIERLQSAEAERTLHDHGQRWWKGKQGEIASLESSVDSARRQFDDTAATLGVSAQASAAWLIGLVRAVREAAESDLAKVQLEASIAATEAQAAELRRSIVERIEPFGYDSAETSVELSERCQRLSVWAQSALEARTAVARRDRFLAQRADFYRNCGLEDGDRTGLEALAQQQQEYRRLLADVQSLEWQLEGRRQKNLHWQRDLEAVNHSLEELDEQIAQGENLAGQRQAIQDAVNAIEVEIAKAERDRSVEEAENRLKLAEDEAELARERFADQQLTNAIIDWLEEALRQDLEPVSLRKAGELFTQATGRYGITAANDGFAAVDMETGLPIALHQLSQGTRLQLLVCVRLGFILAEESGDRPPLLLDETLANSDPERARSLARVVLSLAQDGRQIFYFTSQPSESALWQLVASELGVPFAVHDLGAIRFQAASTVDIREVVAEKWELPLPDPNLPWDEYCRQLPMPTLDPWWAVGQVPIALLVKPEEQALLHRALQMGKPNWGSAARIIQGIDEAWFARVAARADVLGVALRAWQVGTLPSPLTVDDLAAFQPLRKDAAQIVDIYGPLLREPRKLVEQLGTGANGLAKRQQRTLESLAAHFQEAGLWPEDERLTVEEVRLLALEEAARKGVEGAEAGRLLRLLFPETATEAPQPLLFE
jgi:energy-coupling factor transporter ATP-binding protein EcfA2